MGNPQIKGVPVMYEFEITGDDSLKRINERFSSFKKPLAEIGAFMERQVKRRFNTETAPDGSKWQPLTPGRLARKSPGLKILSDGGDLKGGIQFTPPDDFEVFVVASAEYAIYNQVGAKKIKLPARPFLGFSDFDVKAILALVDDYVENG